VTSASLTRQWANYAHKNHYPQSDARPPHRLPKDAKGIRPFVSYKLPPLNFPGARSLQLQHPPSSSSNTKPLLLSSSSGSTVNPAIYYYCTRTRVPLGRMVAVCCHLNPPLFLLSTTIQYSITNPPCYEGLCLFMFYCTGIIRHINSNTTAPLTCVLVKYRSARVATGVSF
jgi:hypothetical protein